MADGNTNADAGTSFFFVMANGAQTAGKIVWTAMSPNVEWATLSADGKDFTLAPGRYMITLTFTPTTSQCGMEGMGCYAIAPAVWTTASCIGYIHSSNTYTGSISCSVNNTYVWTQMMIIRLKAW